MRGLRPLLKFVVYILRDLMSAKSQEKQELSADEIEAIRRRLKALGYF